MSNSTAAEKDTCMPDEKKRFDEWAIVELLGHKKVAGRVTEAVLAGAGFLRVDVPSLPPCSQFYGPGSVYCITPCSEQLARQFALDCDAGPVHEYELPRRLTTEEEEPF